MLTLKINITQYNANTHTIFTQCLKRNHMVVTLYADRCTNTRIFEIVYILYIYIFIRQEEKTVETENLTSSLHLSG